MEALAATFRKSLTAAERCASDQYHRPFAAVPNGYEVQANMWRQALAAVEDAMPGRRPADCKPPATCDQQRFDNVTPSIEEGLRRAVERRDTTIRKLDADLQATEKARSDLHSKLQAIRLFVAG